MSQTVTTTPRPAPARHAVPEAEKLLPFQADGVDWILTRRHCCLADDMGLGKTIQAIAACNELAVKRVLIVCPHSLKLDWRDAWNRWTTLDLVVQCVSSTTRTISGDVLILNYDVIHKWSAAMRQVRWDMAIFDECQFLKNRATRRTRHCLGWGRPSSVSHIPPIEARRVLFLSGTPMEGGRVSEIWPMLHRIDPDQWGQFKPWVRWFTYERSFKVRSASGRMVQVHRSTGVRHAAQLRETLAPVLLRRTKAQVLPQLPPKIERCVAFPPAGMADVIKRECELAELAQAQGPASPHFSELAAIRRRLGEAKIPLVIEQIEGLMEDGQPTLVFAHHISVIEAIAARFKAPAIRGQVDVATRQTIVADFQDGTHDLLVIQIRAGGVGLNLQRAQHVGFAEMDWSPGRMRQAMDRAHRIGQSSRVMVWYWCFDKSFDARMATSLVEKQRVIDAVVEPTT